MNLQSLPQVAFIIGKDGSLFFGPSEPGDPDATEGATIYDQVRPEQREFLRQTLAWVFERGEGSAFELHGLGTRHPESWFQCRVVPNITRGSVLSATLVATDITTYKERELELEQERDRLREQVAEVTARLSEEPVVPRKPSAPASGALLTPLVEQLGEAVLLIDAETGRVVDAGEGACAWLHMSRDQLLAANVRDLNTGIPLLPPDTRREIPFTETRLRPRPVILHGSSRRADGTEFPVQSMLTEVNVGGRRYIMAVVRDAKGSFHAAEQLRELKSRYENLFEGAGIPVLLINRAGVIVDANGPAVALFGYPREEMVGMDARRLLLFRSEEALVLHLSSARNEGTRDLTVQIRQQQGPRVSASFSAIPLLTTGGSIKGYQCIIAPKPTPEGVIDFAPAAEPAVVRPAEPEPAPARPTRSTVLVVTGNATLHADIRATLERDGLVVVHGVDASTARMLMQEEGAELGAIVIDSALGKSRGQELREFMHAAASLPVVVIGDEAELGTTQRLQLRGSVAFLTKPLHGRSLLDRVRLAVERGTETWKRRSVSS